MPFSDAGDTVPASEFQLGEGEVVVEEEEGDSDSTDYYDITVENRKTAKKFNTTETLYSLKFKNLDRVRFRKLPPNQK